VRRRWHLVLEGGHSRGREHLRLQACRRRLGDTTGAERRKAFLLRKGDGSCSVTYGCWHFQHYSFISEFLNENIIRVNSSFLGYLLSSPLRTASEPRCRRRRLLWRVGSECGKAAWLIDGGGAQGRSFAAIGAGRRRRRLWRGSGIPVMLLIVSRPRAAKRDGPVPEKLVGLGRRGGSHRDAGIDQQQRGLAGLWASGKVGLE
jgi:hypothetical protein